MNQDYRDILNMLYDKFGDDLINAGVCVGKDVIVNAWQKKTSQTETEVKSNEVESVNAEDNVSESVDTEDLETDIIKMDANEATDYYDADAFEEETITKLQKDSLNLADSLDVTEAVRNLILMAGEVRKFEDAQITVRTDIAARRDIALAKIEVQKTALMTYLDKSFDERKENFNSLFSVVDDALGKNNMQELALSLEGIIKLAESSPFKDLKSIEETAAALSDPEHEWNF